MKQTDIMFRYRTIEVELSGSHYQPGGCNRAFVTGISWDSEYNRTAIHLTYLNGNEDTIPLSELGKSHVLGNVTIVNTPVALERAKEAY